MSVINPPLQLRRTIRDTYLSIYQPPGRKVDDYEMLCSIKYFRGLRYHWGDKARLSPGKGNRSFRRAYAIRGYADGYRLNSLGLLRKDGAYHLGL